jgi:hypothetical protein
MRGLLCVVCVVLLALICSTAMAQSCPSCVGVSGPQTSQYMNIGGRVVWIQPITPNFGYFNGVPYQLYAQKEMATDQQKVVIINGGESTIVMRGQPATAPTVAAALASRPALVQGQPIRNVIRRVISIPGRVIRRLL